LAVAQFAAKTAGTNLNKDATEILNSLPADQQEIARATGASALLKLGNKPAGGDIKSAVKIALRNSGETDESKLEGGSLAVAMASGGIIRAAQKTVVKSNAVTVRAELLQKAAEDRRKAAEDKAANIPK